MRVLVGVGLLACGALLALYGVFAILPADASGGTDTYVTLAGRQIDAKLVGGIALALAVLTILAARLLLKRPRIAPARPSRVSAKPPN